MSNYERCDTCGEYDFVDSHECAPRWLVLNADDPDADWGIWYARDADEAGEKWAAQEDCDTAEYTIVAGTPVTLYVKPEIGTDLPVLLIVSGEALPSYNAEAARSIRCSWHPCSNHLNRRSIADHEVGEKCEDCGGGRWEATVMLPVDPQPDEVKAAAEGLPL
ncbi:hypothetical protein LCGC14_2070490 [marine sediment metagenome]|uniref:Uncharacterized protein n=1 Tax=marine sediment metagenome TaxID=412755 RepID=A0A0F9F5Y6_9ZZZZ